MADLVPYNPNHSVGVNVDAQVKQAIARVHTNTGQAFQAAADAISNMESRISNPGVKVAFQQLYIRDVGPRLMKDLNAASENTTRAILDAQRRFYETNR